MALARLTRIDQSTLQDLYDDEVANLLATARVKNFVAVIASRRLRQRLLNPS
ncbi:MAG: DUF3562 domain-containing protein [Proteobacteria bacterium]|nr:DUF3562 domain-containing protein [Pseudomonadota bacterium]